MENEPQVGPGMILERGRERVIVENPYCVNQTMGFATIIYRRAPFRKWPLVGISEWMHPATIHNAILNGFRVIRPADQHKEPSP